MFVSVSPRQAFAFQMSRFVRAFVVSHLGSVVDALDIKRARRTNGIARPLGLSGRPRLFHVLETKL